MARILVIEDDDSIQFLLRLVLRSHGHQVLQASNGLEGMKLFQAEPPDLVLTDLLMPEKEGLETIREIRTHTPGAKIIAMSGGSPRWAGMDLLVLADKLGARRVLRKPFGEGELRAAIDDVLGTRVVGPS